MLTMTQNERLTRVGPGTPMGELMRRYWHPIAASAELNDETPTKEIRLLGEDLVLYRDTKGRVGCLEPSCAHRKANLAYGVPEADGIRCAYHGWVYDEAGACVDQPSEPEGSKFKDKVRLKAYPVEELGGLVFVYMGPAPAPLLPRWDILVWENVERKVSSTMLPCNWLQCQENSLDPVHYEWLHRYWGSWQISRQKSAEERAAWDRWTVAKGRHHIKVGFDRFKYGVIKRRLLDGETEDDEWWRVGHPILFPNVLRVGRDRWHAFQYRIPVDDTHTLHLLYNVALPEPGMTAAPQELVPYEEIPLYDERGRIRNDYVAAQDQTAWVIQGAITDRPTEQLGVTDIGLIMFRGMLEDAIKIVEDGGDPMCVIRDPAENDCILLPQEYSRYPGYNEIGGPFKGTPIPKPEMERTLV